MCGEAGTLAQLVLRPEKAHGKQHERGEGGRPALEGKEERELLQPARLGPQGLLF